MKHVTTFCDRCGKRVATVDTPYAASGFYRVGPGSPWERFARPGEATVCNTCMWADPAYQAEYSWAKLYAA